MTAHLDRFRQELQYDSQDALRQRLTNCRANPKYSEHAAIVEAELNRRFPGWDSARTRRGGRRPTTARFNEKQHDFDSARDAYVWLVERFAETIPEVFVNVRFETTGYFGVGLRRSRGTGASRNYFAKSPGGLFLRTPTLAENQSNYRRLTNGWYVNLNLNTRENFEILCRLSTIAELSHGKDWDWEVLDPTEDLHNARKRAEAAAEFQRQVQEWLKEADAQ